MITDMAYRRPVHYFRVPEADRAKRIYETDDFCVIDRETFVIRGVLKIPITDRPGHYFTWGVWAEGPPSSPEDIRLHPRLSWFRREAGSPRRGSRRTPRTSPGRRLPG